MLQIFFNISSDIYYHHLYRPFATNILNGSNPVNSLERRTLVMYQDNKIKRFAKNEVETCWKRNKSR